MTAYFLNFNKNNRSTSQPNVSSATPFTCKLKAPTSLLRPTLQITQAPSNQASWVTGCNYVYLPDFNRYYYVVNHILNGTLIEISCLVDELASWKSAITSSTQYVLRSSSNYNGTIKDTKYPVKAVRPDRSITYGTQIPNPLQPASSSYGVFVIGVVNKGGSLSGCVTYYALSYLVFSTFLLNLFNLTTQWGSGGTDLADGLKKAITDPMQYLVSCMWYPYSVNDFVNRGFATSVSSITVGYDSVALGATGYMFTNSVLNIEFTNLISLTIPDHPQASSRGAYMDFEPFSRYYLSFYPFCSLCELDSTIVGGAGTIYCIYTVDLRSGKGLMWVCTEYNGTTYTDWTPRSPLRAFEAQVGVPVPVATIHTELQNLSQYMTNAVIAAGTEFGGFQQAGTKLVNTLSNRLMGAIANLTGSEDLANAVEEAETRMDTLTMGDLSNVASNAAAMKSTCEMIGSQGTMSSYSRAVVAAWGNFYYAADDNLARFGRPLCSTVQLSTLSGFCQCDSPRISANGMTLQEQLDIENKLRTGIFIE